MKKSILLAGLIVCLFLGSSVFAGRMWFYNEIVGPYGQIIDSGNTAIGMRSGNTWPVVGYATGGSISGTAAMLPGSWAKGTATFSGQYLDGATAPDGTVAFADNDGRVVTLGKTGWGSGTYNGYSQYKSSIAFNNNSSPAVLHRGQGGELTLSAKSGAVWYASTVRDQYSNSIYTDSFAMDFDSYNQANVAFSENGNLRYGTKGVLTGNQWLLSEPMDAPYVPGQLDMALTNNDVPYVIYEENGYLKYATYSRQTDDWMTGVLDAINSNNFCITADNSGGIGVAYVTQFAGQNMLSFAYNGGTGWMLPERLTQADMGKMVGLAFDYENNPVISFVDWNGRMTIAYDPVEIPEPAAMTILALGFALIRRR